MALDFKQLSRKPHSEKYPRNRKRVKEQDGRALSTAKLLKGARWSDWYNYPRVRMDGWLLKQVDRPIDKVFSDFVKEFKKTYKGKDTPKEFFYQYVDEKKKGSKFLGYNKKFYVSESGILCRYSKYSTQNISYKVFNRRREIPKAHIDYNKRVMSEFSLKGWELGPKYLGRLWVTVKGYTKIMNVWIVSTDKFNGKGAIDQKTIPRRQRLYLEQFTPASVAGFGTGYSLFRYKEYWGQIPFNYTFIVKLSDL